MKKNRLFSAFLAAVLAVCGTAIPASAADKQMEKPYEFGDVNGDGTITVSDAVLIARISAEDSSLHLNDFARIAADANQDGQCDQKDLTDILRYIAGLQTTISGKYEDEDHLYTAKNLTEGMTDTLELEAEQAEGFRSAQLDFTANLLKQVAKEKGTANNMLISPYSVAMALGMTANGAKEDTLAEMEKVLGGKLNMKALNESYLNILQHSPASGTTESRSDGYNDYKDASLDIANSIWYHQDPTRIKVPEQFLKNTVDYYHASAYAAKDFDLPVIQDINYWVRSNTHGMIDKILQEDKPYDDVVMVLVNALAFEGDWSIPYRDDQVHKSVFNLENGKEFDTDMMYCDEYIYLEDKEAVGFKKRYAGGKYSFIGVLPNKDISIADYTANLDGKKLEKFLDSATSMYDVHTCMPKFTYDFDANLNNPLIEMGMPTAFDSSKADFTGLDASGTTEKTYISDVLHKTHIELDQKGTRAAAVTAVIMAKATSVGPDTTKTVYLDRPFVYMIYDEEAKLPVFIGTVMEPSAAE